MPAEKDALYANKMQIVSANSAYCNNEEEARISWRFGKLLNQTSPLGLYRILYEICGKAFEDVTVSMKPDAFSR
jgi:hypothetical protein